MKEEKSSDSSTRKKVLFVFATDLECQAFDEKEHILITGMGPEKVREALTASVIQAYDEIWNIGFAGAVDTNLPFGSIHTVSTVGHLLSEHTFSLLSEGKRLITFDAPLHDPELREALASKWDIVDMEGHEVAKIARENGIPCHLIKIISDNADENTTEMVLKNAPILSEALHAYIQQLLK